MSEIEFQDKETENIISESHYEFFFIIHQQQNQETYINEKSQEIPRFIKQANFILFASYVIATFPGAALNLFLKWQLQYCLSIWWFHFALYFILFLIIIFSLVIRFVKTLWNYQFCVFGCFFILIFLLGLLAWPALDTFVFQALIGLFLVQLHIAQTISTEKNIELKIENFWFTVLCGCSSIMIPHETDQQVSLLFLLIVPGVSFFYTFMYVLSVKYIINWKFQLKENQALMGAVLIFCNLFFPWFPKCQNK